MRLIRAYMRRVRAYMGRVRAYMMRIRAYLGLIRAYMGLIRVYMSLIWAYMRHIRAYICTFSSLLSSPLFCPLLFPLLLSLPTKLCLPALNSSPFLSSHQSGDSRLSEAMWWTVFDGPVDPLWTDGIGTVLGEDAQLQLPHGEFVQAPKHNKFIFQVTPLSCHSQISASVLVQSTIR